MSRRDDMKRVVGALLETEPAPAIGGFSPAGTRRIISSVDALVTPGASVALANWQAGGQGGAGATIFGSGALDGNDYSLYKNVRMRVQIKRGGFVTVAEFPWPVSGFVRRTIAEEITVQAVGRAGTFINMGGAPSRYRLSASVQDGMLPETSVVMVGSGATAYLGSTGNQIVAPTGARAFRICVSDDWISNLPVQYRLQYAYRGADSALVAVAAFDIGAAAEWRQWPPWYAGVIVPNTDTGQVAIEFTI